jgi:small subunit ribosomal protein S20
VAARALAARILFKSSIARPGFVAPGPSFAKERVMANTSSARKATRKIARKTEINKTRRTLLRNSVRKVEEAIASGDRNAALAAMKQAEPVIMRAAQRNVVHKNSASRKVSRLTHRIAKLGK